MSTPERQASLARIRENQRRSRARRREYVQELEQRVRSYELQGVEASAGVQVAARRLADENKILRELLNKNGFSQDYIDHHLKSSEVKSNSPEPGQSTKSNDQSSAGEALQQAIVPRTLETVDTNASYRLPRQSLASTSPPNMQSLHSSASWDSLSSGTPTSYAHTGAAPVNPSAINRTTPQLYTHELFMGTSPHHAAAAYDAQGSESDFGTYTPRMNSYHGAQPENNYGNPPSYN